MKNEPPANAVGPILQVRNLTKVFSGRGLFGGRRNFAALDNVSFELPASRTLALVGETGSGKSTLARCLVRLEQATSGEILFLGENLHRLRGARLRLIRRQIQLIFQEPMSALNPRFSALEVIVEPLLMSGMSRDRVNSRALILMDDVGLPRSWADRSSRHFSGGQKQKLALARALAVNPKVIIMDEAVSGLDLSVQAQMINLMLGMQRMYKFACLFITHDLNLVDAVADEIAVMKNGSIVEHSKVASVFGDPKHSYTQSLLAALYSNGEAAPQLAAVDL